MWQVRCGPTSPYGQLITVSFQRFYHESWNEYWVSGLFGPTNVKVARKVLEKKEGNVQNRLIHEI